MNIKFKDIKSADNIFKTILKTPQEARLSYRLAKMLNKFVPTMDKIDDQGNALVRKHGEVQGGQYRVPPDRQEAFTAEFVAYLEQEVEINLEPIPFELIEKTGIKITPDDMIALQQFIEEPNEEVAAVEVLPPPQQPSVVMGQPGVIPPKPTWTPNQ